MFPVPTLVILKLPAVKLIAPLHCCCHAAVFAVQLSSKIPNGRVTPVVITVVLLAQLSILTVEVAPKDSVPPKIPVEGEATVLL
jgi:hypothetical protein